MLQLALFVSHLIKVSGLRIIMEGLPIHLPQKHNIIGRYIQYTKIKGSFFLNLTHEKR